MDCFYSGMALDDYLINNCCYSELALDDCLFDNCFEPGGMLSLSLSFSDTISLGFKCPNLSD